MRIRSVTARSFGRLHEETLRFGDGLNVVVGPNESGKSTWHAAITAAICGMRRGRGRRTKEDQAFTDRHRPWDRDAFEVSGLLELADGRRIELHHDLAGLVDCIALDADLGTDLSGEILNSGTPDGARLIGLDRESFRAVACVGQGEILAVLENAAVLQEHLQRAAATAGTDETATAALEIIEDVLREEVGLDRANSTRPLRQAKDDLDAARATEAEVRRLHEDWQEDLGNLADAERRLVEARGTVAVAEAVLARDRAEAARARVERIEELRTELAEAGDEPDTSLRRRVDSVRDALVAWDNRTEPIEPEGDTAAVLAARLEALPEPPAGDVEVDPSVPGAADELRAARADLDAHERLEPAPVEPVLPVDVDPDAAEALRSRLLAPIPTLPAGPREELTQLEVVPTAAAARRRPLFLGVGALCAIAGVVMLATGAIAFGIVLVAAGVAIGFGGEPAARSAAEQERSRHARIAQLNAIIGAQEDARRRGEEERARAHSQAQQLGLPVDPDELNALLTAHRRAIGSLEEHRRWVERRRELVTGLEEAVSALGTALIARGEADPGLEPDQVLTAHDVYAAACAARAEQAREAALRPRLEEQLEHRRALEEGIAVQRRRVEALAAALHRIAAEVLDPAPAADAEPVTVADHLRRWHDATVPVLRAADRHHRSRAQLETLLDGRSIDEHRAEAETAEARWADAASGVDAAEIAAFDWDGEPADHLDRLRAELARAETDLVKLTAEHELRRRGVPSVAEAVEAVDVALAELERVQALEEDLRETARFLETAQQQTNRDLAPKLAAAVADHIGHITGGRYTDVRVDPSNLMVTVCDPDGRWRPATALSHGTAEQIHLMLRIALADVLTPEGRSVPMLLDDVLVQSDRARSLAVLETLRNIAEDRQIILFSQEDQVVAWAERHLGDGPRHRLVALPVPDAG